MMILQNKYEIGQKVYLVTDTEQIERIVTSIRVYPNGLMYQLSQAATATDHYEFEMSEEKNIEITI